MSITHIIRAPYREYAVIVLLLGAVGYHYTIGGSMLPVIVAAIIGSIMPLWEAFGAVRERKITIEAFNFFALSVSFATGEYLSAAFIALMLAVASWLDWKTEARSTNAVEELLRLKPTKAIRVDGESETVIDAADIREGDVLVIKNGERVPADGTVIYGTAYLNEASLTGESRPVEKAIGDEVYSSTVSESGIIKIRATKVGKDSTLERMARLIEDAAKNKSKAERLADRFAGIFLPIVLVAGAATYFITGNITMTAALFLIVCADDIAVSIPLAVTASLGYAAKRGVIIKGGEWLRALARVDTLVFDKTGTLTYGTFALASAALEPHIDAADFWNRVAVAEKFSEHPVGKALYREALKRSGIPAADPLEVKAVRGVGIWAKVDGHDIAIGNDKLAETYGYDLPEEAHQKFHQNERASQTTMMVFLDGKFAGILGVADTPKEEAAAALKTLKKNGIRLVMLTGDNEAVAKTIAESLGIDEYHAEMTPETKLRTIEALATRGSLAMVGDGVNDAPALARADVGIAMGGGGTAVAVEAADVVILTDRIDRIGEMITLARRTVSVVNGDMVIWLVTNVIGVGLVFSGIASPAFAALYNLLTDFIPLINSARLFKTAPEETSAPVVK
ncbi:MAG: heavy metal translocating P-type ATPase [Undibacterium sp.]